MADYAHSETDKRIAELEKRLAKEYKQAYKETKDKLEKYLSDFKRKDEAKRQEVEDGTLSEKEYKVWRRNQMLTGQRWTDMVDTLAKDLSNVNVIAAQIVKNELADAFVLNANYSEYCIEEGFRTDYGFTLYNRNTVDKLVSENPDLLPEPSVDIPADLRWNKQKIVSNITQAVLQGKSIHDIAKSMADVVGMNKASAVRNARTAMTGAQNAGRQQAYERAEAMGIKLQKEWIATLDGRTRHSHGMADGQKVDINGMFKVGGCKMRYPGDVANGTAEEIYNCRCTMATVEPPEIMQGEDKRMTYSEWLQTKEGQETPKKGQIKQYSGKNSAKNDVDSNVYKTLYNGANEYFEQNGFNNWFNSLSFGEKSSIKAYAGGGSVYLNLNKYLRGEISLEKYAEKCLYSVETAEKRIKNIKSAIDKFELNDNIQVLRVSNADFYKNLKVGDIFKDKAFVSTTTDQSRVDSDAIAQMIIDVPKGTGRGAWVTPIAQNKKENEFLLNSDQEYEVYEKEIWNGIVYLKLRIKV